MKLKRNVNMNTLVAKLEQLNGESNVLQGHFKEAIRLFDNNKLGIAELNYNMDEDLARFTHTYEKIQELLRGF